jgi:hypothetical protein
MATKREVAQLGELLRKRVSLIADREWYRRDSESHLLALATVSEEIDRLSVILIGDREIPPQFKHYLAKKSFEKALQLIETGNGVEEPHE